MAFRVLIIGGAGQVGAAVARALAAEPSCAEVVMVNRKVIALIADLTEKALGKADQYDLDFVDTGWTVNQLCQWLERKARQPSLNPS